MKYFMNSEKSIPIFKLLLVIGYINSVLLLYSIYLAEPIIQDSFYKNLPFLPGFIIIISFILYSFNIFSPYIKKDNFLYKLCLFYLLFNVVIISQMWIIKYGTFYNPDSWIHLSYIKECIFNHGINLQKNFYPTTVLYISEFYLVTSIDPFILYLYSSFIHVFSYTFILYLLLTNLARNSENKLQIGSFFLVILINPLILKEPNFVPWTFNFLFIIMYLYFFLEYIKFSRHEYVFLILLCVVLLTITHLISNFYVLFIMIMLYILTKATIHFNITNKFVFPVTLNLIFVTMVLLLSWLFISTGFAHNQLLNVIEKVPSILFGETTAQQTAISTKSPVNFLLSRINIISNVLLTFISITFITYNKYNKHYEKPSEVENFFLNFVIGGFLLYFMSQYILGKTDFSGVNIRFFYYTSPTFLVFIYFLCNKFSINFNLHSIFPLLFILFLLSVLFIYPRPEFGDVSPLLTGSTYSGLDWSNDNNIITDNSTVISGCDYIVQYLIYKGYNVSTALYGGTNGLLSYFNYDPDKYKHRQYEETFNIKSNKVYLCYYPMMEKYIAYSKSSQPLAGVRYNQITEKKIDKIYDSRGFVIFKLTEPEIQKLKSSVPSMHT